MKALSVLEPYATMILDGEKHIETRSWKTRYRGKTLIHASGAKVPKAYRDNTILMEIVGNRELHFGCIICVADLVDCVEMTEEFISMVDDHERKLGFYEPGRYAYILENITPIKPTQAKGSLGFWEYRMEGI